MKNKLAVIILSTLLLQGCVAATVATVVSGVGIAKDNRTLGKQIDDQSIELTAHSKISDIDGAADNADIQVVSVNGNVLVVGQAATRYLKDKIIKAISQVNGINQLHNQIQIMDPVSLSTKTNDIWLTSKVKTMLLKEEGLNSSSIKVVTENSEVFLMGLVSKKDAEKAVDITRNISGVSRVYKLFEYL